MIIDRDLRVMTQKDLGSMPVGAWFYLKEDGEFNACNVTAEDLQKRPDEWQAWLTNQVKDQVLYLRISKPWKNFAL